jgi:hypothetical protein
MEGRGGGESQGVTDQKKMSGKNRKDKIIQYLYPHCALLTQTQGKRVQASVTGITRTEELGRREINRLIPSGCRVKSILWKIVLTI